MIVSLLLITASVFNVHGLGQEQASFYQPFNGLLDKTRIEFAIRPEYTLIMQAGDSRGHFWFNPFRIGLRLPINQKFSISLANDERFNQAADVYLKNQDLNLHYQSQGGVEELRGHVHFHLPVAELCLGGSYFFGSSREIWTYEMANYAEADTFDYRYRGWTIRAGLTVGFASAAYEGLGHLTMTDADHDSTGDFPGRLTIGISPVLGAWRLTAVFEHSRWPEENPINRFVIGAGRGRFNLLYWYNPWYVSEITEHGLCCRYQYPVKNMGTVRLSMNTIYRQHDAVKELDFVPELKMTFEEIFSRRKK